MRRVIAHLKAHKKITANDVISRPTLKKKKGKGPSEEIPWAHAEIIGSWQSDEITSKNNKNVLYAKEHGKWKLVVPENEVENYLRRSLLDPDSKMPFGRDSAYHIVQQDTIGISRRRLQTFLEKQSVLQMTRNIPNEQQKQGILRKTRGTCEMDLIEGKGIDVMDAYSYTGDWYWLAVVELMTGYGQVALLKTKKPKEVAKRLEEILNVMEKKLKAKVYRIHADHGREFYTDVTKLLKRRKIKMKQVPRGSRVEKFNQTFQRNFYRLVKLRRGGFNSVQNQALELTNNTKNKWTKHTPEECLQMSDVVLSKLYNKGRQQNKPYKGRRLEVGDQVRHLVKMRKNIKPILTIKGQARLYKTYQGRHFTKQVFKIRKIINQPKDGEKKRTTVPPRYFLNGQWFNRDQLLPITGVDAETDRQISERKK